MITVAALSPSLDVTYVVDALRRGQIHRPTAVVRCAGGKSLNFARAAATLGADVAVVAVLGGSTGDMIRTLLADAPLTLTVVATPVETRMCVSLASSDDASLTEVYAHAADLPDDTWQQVLAEVSQAMASRPGWLCISGAPPGNLAEDAVSQLVRRAADAGVAAAVDTHGPALRAAITARPSLVKVNRAEAVELCATWSGDVSPPDTLEELAAAILARTGGIVVVTDGFGPVLAVANGQAWELAAPPIRAAYPVGSGDAFLAGLVATLDAGGTVEAALRRGMASGIANAMTPGPGLLDARTVAELAATLALRPV